MPVISTPPCFLLFFEGSDWANYASLAGVVLTLVAAAPTFWTAYQRWQTERIVKRGFGTDSWGTQEEIRRETRNYVRPFCSSVDPAQEAEIRHVIATEEDLFSTIDKYLADTSLKRHILLLADSGMGKSSFVTNYYVYNQNRRKRQRKRLAIVSLSKPDALEKIHKIDNQKETVLFLDAFDEDVKAIQDHRARLAEIMHACEQFKRVLITCRTQFFLKDEEIPRETGIIRVGSRSSEGRTYEFWKLYLSPFNGDQIEKYLRLRYPFGSRANREKARQLVKKIELLTARPLLLTFIPDVLKEALEQGLRITYAYQLYEATVEKWLEREKAWVGKEELRDLSELLAIELYANHGKRGSRIPRDALSTLLKFANIHIEDWKVTGRSLLNRDAAGNYKFAHRSIMEYLFVKKFIEGDPRCVGVELTDYMKSFLLDMAKNRRSQSQEIRLDLSDRLLAWKQCFPEPLFYKAIRALPSKTYNDVYGGFQDLNGQVTSEEPLFHIYALYNRINDAVVFDYSLGLVWQRGGSDIRLTVAQAGDYINDLNAQRFGGYNDWRLPTFEEAASIFHFSDSRLESRKEFHLDEWFDRSQTPVWTSDLVPTDSNKAAQLWLSLPERINYGEWSSLLNQTVSAKKEACHVRAVRSGPPPSEEAVR